MSMWVSVSLLLSRVFRVSSSLTRTIWVDWSTSNRNGERCCSYSSRNSSKNAHRFPYSVESFDFFSPSFSFSPDSRICDKSRFVELYTPGILPTSKRYSLASQHALAQEATLYSKSNKMTYRNSCISCLARLKKRPPASKLNDTGTMEEYDSKVKEREEKEKGKLTRDRVEGFVHDEETLKRYGYLLKVPNGEGGDIPNEVGQTKSCDRCKLEFVVKNDLSQVSLSGSFQTLFRSDL